jgi:hypothetical protein
MAPRDSFQYAIPQVFETVNDAAREVVRALGGTKQIGPKLWPGKEAADAQRHLNDCLNSDRPQRLTPDELITLARWGRDLGCHALASFFNERAGYAPPVPVSPEDEKAELQRRTVEGISYLRGLIERLETINAK